MMLDAHLPVHIAVIGAGVIGRVHIHEVQASKDAILAALVDPTQGGEQIAKANGCDYFSSVQGLLESTVKIDAAIVCTPNDTHVSISQKLAGVAMHLLIEKPMTTSVNEGRKLLECCRYRMVKICVGHHRRFHSSIMAAKKALESSAIGAVVGVSGVWASLKTDSYFRGQGQWRGMENGGVVLINLIHELDLLQYLIGPITRVFAERAASTRGNVAEEGAAVTLRFQNGVVGTFLVLDNSPTPFSMERGTGENPTFPFTGKDCYRFFGQKGTLSVPDGAVWRPVDLEKGWHSDLIEQKLPFDETEVYKKQLENFIGVVRGTEEPRCSGESALAAVAVCEAIRKSLSTGMPVNVETGIV